MGGERIVVIGGSAGSVDTLRTLVSGLPADFAAAVLVVVHIPPHHKSFLPVMLSNAGPLPARHAEDGEEVEAGRIYLAPPDHHMLLRNNHVHLVRGPRENGHRPAVDPLFRSAAQCCGPRAIGVVITGALDDGTTGLFAIKEAGGIAVVQDPDDATFSSMPRSALRYVEVDHVVALAEMPELLTRLSREPVPERSTGGAPGVAETGPQEGETRPPQMPGKASGFTCPECHGATWEVRMGDLLQFRCRIGHTLSAESLLARQAEEVEATLETSLQSIEEMAELWGRLAERSRQARGEPAFARRYAGRAERAARLARLVRAQLEEGLWDDDAQGDPET